MALDLIGVQKDIVESRGKNILVSASAGCGKTTVMIRRILELMLDKNGRTPISNFLVVTFTKASAADMKQKLIDELLEHSDDEFCLEQIDLLETSDISTLHSFCSRLISAYFFEVGLDPEFSVIEDVTSRFLKDRAIEKLFEEKEKQGDAEYFRLYEIFQKKRQSEGLKKVIEKFSSFLAANINSEKWFFDTIESAYNLDFSKNTCVQEINGYVASKVRDLVKQIEEFIEFCRPYDLEKVEDYFADIADQLKTVNDRNSFEVNNKNMFAVDMKRIPTVSSSVEIKPQITEFKDFLGKEIKNLKKNCVVNDIEYLKLGLSETKTCVLALYKLVKRFDEIYGEMKREINSLDFNDLEKYSLQILKNPDILQAVRSKYKYVFVDEYQDVNSVQEEIISLVSGKNNRFMVGDVKQSIYRFRLSDPDIFVDKYNSYSKKTDKNSELFNLNLNFRSDKNILKFVDTIFSGVMTKKFGNVDYEKDAKFEPYERNCDVDGSVEVCLIDTQKEKAELPAVKGVYSVQNHQQSDLEDEERGALEARIVADKITQIKQTEEKEGKEFKYENIAILVGSRKCAMVEKFIECIKSYGIKIAGEDKYDLAKKPYIQEILNFVKLCVNFNDDFVLVRVLKSRFFNFSDNDLSTIRLIDPKCRFFDCVKKYSLAADDELKEKLKDFNEQIERYAALSRMLPLKDFCKKIIEDFSIYEINDASFEYGQARNDINMFLSALPDTSVVDFVIKFADFSLEIESENSGDYVKLMTIHKSKGIDFNYVFLINTTGLFNFESTNDSLLLNKDLGVGMNYYDIQKRTVIDSIASSGMRLSERRKLVEEQQRVLYVALTRAKLKLFVICSKDKNKIQPTIKEHKNSFFDWFEPTVYKLLNNQYTGNVKFYVYSAKDLADRPKNEQRVLLFKDAEETEPDWFEYKHSDAQKFALKTSISKIIKSAETDEQNFVGTGSSAERGTAYHRVFQMLDYKNMAGIETQVESVIKQLNFEKIVDVAKIKNVVKMSIFQEIAGAKYIFTEKEFFAKLPTDILEKSNAEGEFLLQGVIDLVAVFDDYLILLDYKTGRMNDAKMQGYKFQLDLYSMIAEKVFDLKVKKKILCLVDEQKIIEI